MAGFVYSDTEKVNCCYFDTLSNFLKLKLSGEEWAQEMQKSVQAVFCHSVGKAQLRSWEDCYNVSKQQFNELKDIYGDLYVVFEYGFREFHDKRPDVLLVCNEAVIIAEFKRKETGIQADVDQAANYGRKMRDGHIGCQDKNVYRMLVDTHAPEETYENIVEKELLRVSAVRYAEGIQDCLKDMNVSKIDNILEWLRSEFKDRPDIIEGSIKTFNGGDIGDIRPVLTPELQAIFEQRKRYLLEAAQDAERNKEFVLATLTGVPGAGKTYMGLSFAYEASENKEKPISVYVSGNGPLVSVLQHNLRRDDHDTPFVRPVHDILYKFIRRHDNTIKRNIIAFDEGQRAWNLERMNKQYGQYNYGGKSEPQTIIDMVEQENDWCFILLLIGDGQEINAGENTDLNQWNEALNNAQNDWHILCSNNDRDEAANTFHGAHIARIDRRDFLYMDRCIRTEQAQDTSLFINHILDGRIAEARAILEEGRLKDYNFYVTRNLDAAKKYCSDYYKGSKRKQYGLIASSKGNLLRKFNFDNSYEGTHIEAGIIDGVQQYRDINYAAWYTGDADVDGSCCNFQKVVTEFGCQGLELDFSIVGWDNDMLWYKQSWHPWGKDSISRTYRKNSYRVLLTRGRVGTIVYIPNTWEFTNTYKLLTVEIGLPVLP